MATKHNSRTWHKRWVAMWWRIGMHIITTSLLLLVALATGCLDNRPEFAWPLGTEPAAQLADGTADPRWTQIVGAAAASWSIPLAQMGCDDPFRGSNRNPVVLVSDAEWTNPTAIGDTESYDITIKGTVNEMLANLSYETTVPHEFGHALGLEHVLDGSDPDSVMLVPASNKAPSRLDLEHAATVIGCDWHPLPIKADPHR